MAKQDYRIINDRIKPDLAGELGGVKIQQRGDMRVVSMTEAQAQWFLDHGQIAPLGKPVGQERRPSPKAS